MKSVRKTALIGIIVSVIASVLMVAASAEGLPAGGTAVQTPQQQSVVPVPDNSSSSSGNTAPTENNSASPPAGSNENKDTAPAIISDLKSSLISTLSVQDAMMSAGRAIADFTSQFNGFRYIYGAASPMKGFDCSGLIYYVYGQFGYTLPRTAHLQYKNGTSVSKTDLQPGDLLFFATNGGRSVSHVGMYIGNGMFIHAATSRLGVMISRIDNSYWTKVLVGAKRIITSKSAMEYVYATPLADPA